MLLVRRVVGKSMLPALRPGQIVVALRFTGRLIPGSVVIVRHRSREKIKRVHAVGDSELFVLGDNASESTDSRQFGPVPVDSVIAKVIWPRL